MITLNIISETVRVFDPETEEWNEITVSKPKRSLTKEELMTVTSSESDSEKIIHYQGDEPIIAEE